MNRNETGRLGEERICAYLSDRGYNIAARNVRIKGGEIDIVAENGDYIAFVEVKSRKPNSMVGGFEAVNRRKQSLIIRTACEYMRRNPNLLQPRFDIAEVIIDRGNVLGIDYIENAFDTTGYDIYF